MFIIRLDMLRVYKHVNQMSTLPVEFHRHLAHAQTVETRPFSPPCLRPGNEARAPTLTYYSSNVFTVRIEMEQQLNIISLGMGPNFDHYCSMCRATM